MKSALLGLALLFSAHVALADGTPVTVDFTKADWQLVTLDGTALKAPVTINLGEPGNVSGQAPCNRYFGPVTVDGLSIKFGMLGASMMACEYLDDEHSFLTALQAVDMVGRDGNSLTLSGGGHELVFALPQ